MDAVVAPAAMVRFITATIPFEMIPESEPDTIQVYVPVLPKQLRVFEEPVEAVPGVAEMEATLAAGYANVHWRDAGSLPVGDAKVTFREAVPFAAAAPEDSVKESVWATAAGAKRRAMARADAPRPRDCDNTAIESTRVIRIG